MPRETSSPIDLALPPLPRPGLVWTTFVIATATVLLLLANAVSLHDWLEDLPPGPIQARAAELAGQWVDLGEAIGVGRPRTWLHGLWKAAEAARF